VPQPPETCLIFHGYLAVSDVVALSLAVGRVRGSQSCTRSRKLCMAGSTVYLRHTMGVVSVQLRIYHW